jgi:hypothetical protein
VTESSHIRKTDLDVVISDPLFAKGYDEVWRGREAGHDRNWEPEERRAYDRGRQFAIYVRDYDEGTRVPLRKASMAHPRARLLLMIAMKDQLVI